MAHSDCGFNALNFKENTCISTNTNNELNNKPPKVDGSKNYELVEKYIEPKKSVSNRVNEALKKAKVYADENNDQTTISWIEKAQTEGANEPYIGRDFHSVYALQNPNTKKLPIQPIPVPFEKIKDLNGVLGKGVLTGDSDPFLWIDTKYLTSKKLLRREKGKKLDIFTILILLLEVKVFKP